MSLNLTASHGGSPFCTANLYKNIQWPITPSGTLSVIPCTPLTTNFNASIDTTGSRAGYQRLVLGNLTRLCYPNGTWSPKVNWDTVLCTKAYRLNEPKTSTALTIYYTGYAISLASLMIALIILTSIKSLRCTRNTIHCNLIASFVGSILSWIFLSYSVKMQPFEKGTPFFSTKIHVCGLISFVYNLTYTSTYFWMLAEGVFLYQLIFRGFGNTVSSIRYFLLLGWGAPLAIVITLTAVRYKYIGYICMWVNNGRDRSHYMLGYVYVIIIAVNAIIFGIIVIFVWKKAMSNHNTTRSKSYKGLFFLAILLGVTHILITRNDPIVKTIIAPTLISFQGFLVSLYFCFLNDEVQEAIVSQFKKWKNRRDSNTTHISSFGSIHRNSNKVTEPVKELQVDKISLCQRLFMNWNFVLRRPLKPLNEDGGKIEVTQNLLMVKCEEDMVIRDTLDC